MKFALRAMAQSLAREMGPKGVHVAHVVVDGVIDTPNTKGYDKGEGGKIDPVAVSTSSFYLFQYEERNTKGLIVIVGLVELGGFVNGVLIVIIMGQIADAYWHLHTQPKTAFTWEIDIRPSIETW